MGGIRRKEPWEAIIPLITEPPFDMDYTLIGNQVVILGFCFS
jgi:hypothetical protein